MLRLRSRRNGFARRRPPSAWRGRCNSLRPYHHDDIPIEAAHAAQQAFERELVYPAGDQGGYIRLLQSEQVSGLGLGQLAALEDVADFTDELRFQQLFLGPLETEVGENVAAAAFDGEFGFHRRLVARMERSAIRERSSHSRGGPRISLALHPGYVCRRAIQWTASSPPALELAATLVTRDRAIIAYGEMGNVSVLAC